VLLRVDHWLGAMMSARLDAAKTLPVATKPLYRVLSDAQKKIADELMAPRPMGMAATRMGEWRWASTRQHGGARLD
jgi:predicted DNA-binding protein (UPF0251 family)